MGKLPISELLDDISSPRIIPAVSIGLVIGILLVTVMTSFSAMIFSGELSGMATRAVGLTLFGCFLLCLIATVTSGYKAAISLPQDAPTAVLSTVAVAIAAKLGMDTALEAKFMTVTAVLILSSIISGAVFIIIGKFQLANLLRFMPYPVVGGFLAGTGWLLAMGGITVMCDVSISVETIPRLVMMDAMFKWVPGVLYGVLLFVVLHRWSHFLILPGSLAAVTLVFYGIFAVVGMSVEEAKTAGYLVSGVPSGGLWPAFTLGSFSFIDWPTVAGQFPGILAVVLVAVVGMLLNISGIELAAGDEMDINNEFLTGGAANLLAGMGGAAPGYPSISLSLLGLKTGAYTRWTGITATLVVAGVLFFGGALLEYFPKALLGGILLLLGLSFIYEWVVASRKRIPVPDYLIMVSIFLVIGIFGFMEGVAFGLVAAVIFFVFRFSRVPLIKEEFTGMKRHSLKIRSIPHRKILSVWGKQIRGYELAGYIFFGSAATLVESLKGRLAAQRPPDFILLDFKQVSGFDISAVNNFHRFSLSAVAAKTGIVITGSSERLMAVLEQNLPKTAMENITFFPDLDHGLEWCEDRLIEHILKNKPDEAWEGEDLFNRSVDDFMAHLEHQAYFEALVDRLAPWLEYTKHPAGSFILKKGKSYQGLYLLIKGTATEIDPGSGARKGCLMPGGVMAASAAFGKYTAETDITADSDCQTALLSYDARILVELEKPGLALALYKFLLGTENQ
jgi:SulP family sulfate permease